MMVATLALALAVGAAGSSADRHLVLVKLDRTWELVEGSNFDPASHPEVHHLWVWSQDAAPRRLAPSAWTQPLPPEREKLAVKVALRADVAPSALSVIAAPVAMWGEIPEDLLPRWTVSKQGTVRIPRPVTEPWRLRVVGAQVGCAWIEIAPGRTEVSVVALSAPDHVLEPVVAGGTTPKAAVLQVFAPAAGRPEGARDLALFRLSPAFRFTIPALPVHEDLMLVVLAPEFAPAVVPVSSADFPATITLLPGARLRGLIRDPEQQPVSGGVVAVECFVAPTLPVQLPRTAFADADGAWKVLGLPRGKAIVYVAAKGFAVHRRELELTEGELDLGAIVLQPTAQFHVRVLDDLGVPVAGALVTASAAMGGATDSSGAVTMRAVAADEALKVAVTAEGHVATEATFSPPFSEEAVVRLARAFTVKARLVDRDGVPVLDAEAQVEIGNSQRMIAAPGGVFRDDLPPNAGAEIVFRSPSTDEVRLHVAPGQPGDTRDLGDVRMPEGFSIAGRVVGARDGSPVAGARVWTPRPSKEGPLVAWMLKDLLQATSGEDGSFRLRGVRSGTVSLRIDAAGFARAQRVVTIKEAVRADIGEVRLRPGAIVRVRVDGSHEGDAIARVDLGGEWLESDMLTAPVRDGTALIDHVPSGPATMSVMAGAKLICETKIDVPEAGKLDVTCKASSVKLHGRVLVGSLPSGPGVLTWSSASAGSYPQAIMNYRSPGGLRQQQTFLGERPEINTAVRDDGGFETDEIRPGSWRVSFTAASGAAPTPSKSIVIPEISSSEVQLEFSGLGLRGIVFDEERSPVADARIRDLASGAFGMSDTSGAFSLSGLAAGLHRLQATAGTEVSDAVTVQLDPDRPADPVELRIARSNSATVPVRVLGRDGRGLGGALVFVELPGGAQILTTDNDGRLTARIAKPFPNQLRAAAFGNGSWAFGNWQPWEDARQGMRLALDRCGSLVVASEGPNGSPQVSTEGGWDVSWLLTRLGSRPNVAPATPLVLGGLPEGTYHVVLEGATQSVSIQDRREAKLTFR